MAKEKSQNQPANNSVLGFEATVWATADEPRGDLAVAEDKHIAPAEKGGCSHEGVVKHLRPQFSDTLGL